jgi:non-heme chloroperoxidase
MMVRTKLAFAAACLALVAACSPQITTPQNISPPAIYFITVEKNVQLEVIDWGGEGKPIVLLAGGGNTAHVFDDFAPKLSTRFHVYGITRRGFGSSQFSAVDDKDRLAKDILVVLDSMKIHNPVLVGHSIAGVELSSIASISQDRVSGLVYLEAGYPYAFSDGHSPGMNEFFNVKGPQQPAPEEKDLISFKALQDWNTKTYGFQLPETEFRQTWDSSAEDKVLRRRDSPGFAIFSTMLNNSKRYDSIPLPSLVIFAIPHDKEAWMIKTTDDKVRNEAATYFSKIDSLTMKQAKAFESGVPSAQVVKLRGMHYIFISNETEVINLIRQFIRKLK